MLEFEHMIKDSTLLEGGNGPYEHSKIKFNITSSKSIGAISCDTDESTSDTCASDMQRYSGAVMGPERNMNTVYLMRSECDFLFTHAFDYCAVR